MVKELTLLILLNLPNGEQLVQSETILPAKICLEVQESIWHGENEIAYTTDTGPVPVVDAACIPVGSL